MDTIELLEESVKIESHSSVDEIRELLINEIPGAETHSSGCLVAEKGQEEGNTVVLNTHMDVVSPHVEFDRDEDIIRGRGSCDAKASIAAMVTAFRNISPSQGKVKLVISPDEEDKSEGLYEYLSNTEGEIGDMAVVGEPTQLDLCAAARGRFELCVDFIGEAAHAASPEAGRNAISCASEAVRRIDAMEGMTDDLLGKSTATVTSIEGGDALNQVPEKASLFIDRRSVPPETQDEFLEKIRSLVEDIECNTEVSFSERPTPFLEAFRTEEGSEVVNLLSRAVEANGVEPIVRPFDAATEASYLAEEMPVVVFGPGAISENGEPVAHSEREYVRVDEVVKASEILGEFLEDAV